MRQHDDSDPDLEIAQQHMEQLRDRVRAELIERYHCAVIASRAARKAGFFEESKVRVDEAELVKAMIQSLDAGGQHFTHLQEGR